MRHRILTCKHHPVLRWSTKEIAWTNGYNGCRNIFFMGETTGVMHSDNSGVQCDPATECICPSSDLILAPEDSLVKTMARQPDGSWAYPA